ncbi:MAG: winged helix-turn-helix domain-containing protein [Pseudomonadota bacterium]
MRTEERFMVGSWQVEPDRDRITHGQESTLLRPQVMNLLVYFVELEGKVAKYDDLLRDLWPNKVVSDATVYNCVAELRQALDNEV